MRRFPSDDDDRKEVERQRIQPWMLDCLKLNPEYVYWGPYEDYMWKPGANEPDPEPPSNLVDAMFTPRKSHGWDSRVITEKWADLGFGLDELNEVVNFYFYAERDAKKCAACDGSGHNAATKLIADTFYEHSSPTGEFWSDKITQDEADALVAHSRLHDLTSVFVAGDGWKKKDAPNPTAEEVNTWQRGRGIGHDAINRWILVETRAKRLGVYGSCETCDGEGHLFTADHARLGLVLWVLHPRKGCSRGVDVKNVREDELPAVFAYLAEAAQRNADRFKGITSQLVTT